MADPDLNRPVWLTAAQRTRLARAARAAQAHPDSRHADALLRALTDTEARRHDPAVVVRVVVAGLHLPVDTLPVMVTDAAVAELVALGALDLSLLPLLAPDPNDATHERHD